MPRYWLLKSEPAEFSIDDLRRDGFACWDGIRNYQARNFMRDEMQLGDLALFYHSNSNPSGCVGICRICRLNIPDTTALDPKSKYYDPRAKAANLGWIMVEVEFVKKFNSIIPLQEMKQLPEFESNSYIQKNSRLSIIPLEKTQFEAINHIASQTDLQVAQSL